MSVLKHSFQGSTLRGFLSCLAENPPPSHAHPAFSLSFFRVMTVCSSNDTHCHAGPSQSMFSEKGACAGDGSVPFNLCGKSEGVLVEGDWGL